MKKYEKITAEEKKELEEMLHIQIFKDCKPEQIDGGWIFTVTIQNIRFQVGMTEEELRAAINCTIEIVEEMKSIWNSGITEDRFQEICEEESEKVNGNELLKQMFVMQRISTTVLTEIIGRLPEIMRIGGAYYMFVSRPSLMNVLYAVYEKMAENLDDESYYGTALYFVLRGILKMHSVQMEDE